MNRKVLLLLNPKAGKADVKKRLLEIVDLFVKSGYDVTVRPSQKKREISQIIKKEGSKYGLVVCCGGDGTLNETINGLMTMPFADEETAALNRPILGYIPTGTTNDYASSLQLPKDIIEASKVILEGYTYLCDVGTFNERYFAYIAAFGVFTDISYKTPHKSKIIFGKIAYFIQAIKTKIKLKSYHLSIETPDRQFEGDYIFGMVTNSKFVAGFKEIDSEKIRMDDGLLEVMLIKTPRNLKELNKIISSFLMQDKNCEFILRFKTDQLNIISPTQIPWTIDGEYGGNDRDVTIKNKKKAIKIIAKK